MQHLLRNPNPFTAVVTSNYSSAVGAMQNLRENGSRIPDDVAVIAFDDTLGAIAQMPPVTTIHQQTFDLGYQAVELLLEYINGDRREPAIIQVPGQLVIRRSCGCGSNRVSQALSLSGSITPMVVHVAQKMAEAVSTEIEHLHPHVVQATFEAFINAFRNSVEENTLSYFSAALPVLLQQFEAVGEDVFLLHPAFSVLRDNLNTLTPVGTDPQARQFAEDMLDQSRLAISEASRRQDAQYLTQQAVVTDCMGIMTAQLLATLDEIQILDTLSTHLPSIGIRHAQIAILNQMKTTL